MTMLMNYKENTDDCYAIIADENWGIGGIASALGRRCRRMRRYYTDIKAYTSILRGVRSRTVAGHSGWRRLVALRRSCVVDSLSTERFFSVKTPGSPDLKADMEKQYL